MTRDHEPATFDDHEDTSVVSTADVGGFFGGRFRIDQRLGSGAMGRVLAALDTQTGRLVALKVLHRDRSKDPDVLRRFGREARALSAIAHPAIVGIVASGRAPDGTPWLAMEHLAGRTLKDRIKQGPMHIDELWPIMKTLAEAMGSAHEAGVVHRDLKPENIILLNQPPPVVKILDFGLSRLSRENEKYTKTGQVLGTPRYMAPELLASGRAPDHRVDVFALGVITFEALTGQSIYTAEDLGSLFGQILEGRTRRLRELRPDLGETMEVLIQQATARDADERFGSVLAFVTAFGHAAGKADQPTQPKRLAVAELFDDVTTHDDAAPLLDPFSGGTVVAPPPHAVGTPPSGVSPRAAIPAPRHSPTPSGPIARPPITDAWRHGPTPAHPIHQQTIPDSPMAASRLRAPTPAPMPRPRAMTPPPQQPLADTRMPAAGQAYPPAAARADAPTGPSPAQAYPQGAPTIMGNEAMMASMAATPQAPSLGAAAAPGSAQLSFSVPIRENSRPPDFGPRASAAAAPPPAPGPVPVFAAPPRVEFSAPAASLRPQAPLARNSPLAAPPAPAPSQGMPFWAMFGVAAVVVIIVAIAGGLLLRWLTMHGHI